MISYSGEKAETRTTSPNIVPINVTKSSLGIMYMPLVLETMEGMYKQLMDDGLLSEGHVTRWGLVQSCGQTEVFTNDCASSVLETTTTETKMCQQ